MSVETQPGTGITLEQLYRDQRGELYRALVIITGSRDVAIEAIDRGYRSWHRRIRRSQGRRPEVEILERAVRWARRRIAKSGTAIVGFRLPAPELDESERGISERFAALPFDQRVAVVTIDLLSWDRDDAAHAAGIDATALAALRSQALTTVGGGESITPEAVAAALGATVVTLREPLSRYESVRAVGTAQRVGTMTAAAAATMLLIGGAVLVAGSPDDPVVAAPTGPDASGPVAASGIGEEVAWMRVPLPIRDGEANAVAFGPRGFVVLAQQWAEAPSTLVLHSADGVEWEVVGNLLQNQDGWVAHLHATETGFVAAGQLFDDRTGREQPAVWHSGDGVEWTRLDLDIDTSIDVAGTSIDLYTWVNSLSSGPAGTTILATQHAEFDIEPLLRNAVEDFDFEEGFGWSDQGIEIYSNQGRIIQRIPWEDVDIDEELVRLVTSGRTVMSTSSDGVTWTSRVLDGPAGRGHVGAVAMAGDVVAAMIHGQFGGAVWSGSLDGEWTRAELPGIAMAQSVAALGDTLVALGSTADGGGAAWLSSDGVAWERIDTEALSGTVYGAFSSGSGLAAFGETGVEQRMPQAAIVDVPDGRLEITPAGLYTLYDAEGAEVLQVPVEDLVYDGDDVILLDPDTGEPVITLTQDEIDFAFETMFRQFEREPGPMVEPERFIVFTEDGRNWQRIDLAQAGSSFYPNGMAVGEGVIVLTGHDEGGGMFREGPPSPVLWVGSVAP